MKQRSITPTDSRPTLPAPAPALVPDRYLQITEVMHLTTYSKSAIYDKMRCGKFPKRIKLSARRTVWKESEIQAWIRGEFTPVEAAPVVSIFGGEVSQ